MTQTSKPLAATPPMGWNSWNMLGSRISETAIMETARAMVSSGLRDHGYEYIVVDDCWSHKDGRDPDGDLIPEPEKFPNGIQAVVDYVHSLGFKFGIYACASERTCAGYPGSYGFEEQDAQRWAMWGVDFLKYDYCGAPQDQAAAIERYSRMGQALHKTGREFLYSLCEWGGRSPHLWGREAGGHMWRVSGDVFDSWVDIWMPGWNSYTKGVDALIDIADGLAEFGGPGGWNDMDMLVVGLRGKGHVTGGGMSLIEYQTHMSMWCMACSPLMIGCDVRALDSETAALLMNREVLAVNQDRLGKPGRRVKTFGPCEIWQKPLGDGSTAVALLNRGSVGNDITLKAADLGLPRSSKMVRDLWAGQEVKDFKASLSRHVHPHETLLLRISS